MKLYVKDEQAGNRPATFTECIGAALNTYVLFTSLTAVRSQEDLHFQDQSMLGPPIKKAGCKSRLF